MLLNLVVYFLLVLINGFFAMAEVALLSADKNTLRRLRKHNKYAHLAFDLASTPNRFLATVQISITLVGIVAGTMGGIAFVEPLASQISRFTTFAGNAEFLSLLVITLFSTFVFLVFGELLPKRVAMLSPTSIVLKIAGLMHLLSKLFHPIIVLLSWTVNFFLSFIPSKHIEVPKIQDADIINLLYEGTKTGVFLQEEQKIIENTLEVGDKKVRDLLTPTSEIVWFNLQDDPKDIAENLLKVFFEELPVADGSLTLKNLVGVVQTKDLLKYVFNLGDYSKLHDIFSDPLIVYEDDPVLQIIANFNQIDNRMILVKNRSEELVGLITVDDVLDEIGGLL